LLEKGVPFEHKIIDLSAKPDEFVSKYREAAGGAGGSAKVPLLVHGDNVVIESEIVAKYVAEHVHRDGKFNDDLYPSSSNPADCKRIDEFLEVWEDVVDSYYNVLTVPPSMGEVGARNTMNILESSLGALEDALNQITEVSEGGSGDFLLGDSFSLAECIAAPWVQRLFVTLPYFRSVDFRKTVLPYKRTKKWMDAVRARSSVTVTKCPEDEIVAAARRYYVSYISPGSPGAME